jgi:hypothetical protein
LFAGEDADGFVDHGVVAGLGGCYVFGFLEGGEGLLFVAVDEVAAGEVYAVRLIQGGAIDLVRHLLSCNDQSSIKIAE